MDSCSYCGGGGAHDPGCPAALAASPDVSSNDRKFSELPDWLQAERLDRCAFCRGIKEHTEECSLADPVAPDFSDIDLLDRAMAFGDTAWLEKTRDYCSEQGMSDTEIDRAIACQQIREKTHAAMRKELADRLAERPVPTREELSQGAFNEMVEPQVRDAMRVMRQKGYATAASGFNSLDAQSMVLSSPDLLDLTPDEVGTLERTGVRLAEGRDGFNFRAEQADLALLKKKWDLIAALLPDLGHAASDAVHPAARQFRKKYGKRAR